MASTRHTLVDAVIDLSAIVGYSQIGVKDVCGMAGVTSRTFYNNFASLNDVFYAACVRMHEALRTSIQEAHDGAATPDERLTACVAALIGFVQADPLRAEALFVQSYGGGERVAALRMETLDWLLQLLSGREAHLGSAELLPFEVAIGGVNGLICGRIQAGEVSGLSAHAEAMVETLRMPETLRAVA